MMRSARRWIPWLAALFILGCGGTGATMRIGTKAFAEQQIVGHLLRQVLLAKHSQRAQLIECGDTYDCESALRTERIDLLLEYSGTAALYLGLDPKSEDARARVEGAYSDRGLVWRPPLGFDNGYVLVVSNRRAQTAGLSTIADLATIEGGVRLSCPRTYLRRPGDGLAALLGRYGLRLEGEPLVVAQPVDRIAAVLAGRADVAVLYATDGALRDGGVTVLEDSLDFFPRYEASFVVRATSLSAYPGLDEAMAALEGKLDNATLVALNHAVQLEGWKPSDIARRHLVDHEMIVPEDVPTRGRLELELAVSERDSFGASQTRAVLALRRVFPERPIRVEDGADPIREVASGGAKLALLGAERFFRPTRRGLERRRQVEAVAVVGSRMAHLLTASPDGGLAGRIGIGPRKSGSAQIGGALVKAAGAKVTLSSTHDQLIEALAGGQLDAAIVVAESGTKIVGEAIAGGRVHLRPITELVPADAPYLRRSRIPADTYPGQTTPIETLASQVVLAGPSRHPHPSGLKGGPAAALLVEAKPISVEQAQLLADATGVPELPDPILPAAHLGAPDTSEAEGNAVMDTVLNALVMLFLGWLAWQLVPKSPQSRRTEPQD
jgi:glycine betaine/choline ABC-type transport system substrate-binding protein